MNVGLIALRCTVVVNRGKMVDEGGGRGVSRRIPQAVELLEEIVMFFGILFLVSNGRIYFLGPCHDLSMEGVIIGESGGVLCCFGGHYHWGGG